MSTKRKIVMTIVFLFGMSLLAVMAFVMISRSQVKQYKEYSRSQVHEATRAITELHEINIYWVVHDYTLWDQLIENVNDPDTAWLNENLGEILYWFELNGIWVLNLDGEIIYKDIAGCAKFLDMALFNDDLLGRVKEEEFVDFYTLANDSLVLLQGAGIHPTADYQRETDLNGYMFLAKCWDKKLIDLLGTLTGSELSLRFGDELADFYEDTLDLSIPYRGLGGEVEALLEYEKHMDFAELLRQNSRNLILLLLLGTIAGFFLMSYVLHKWVTKPLALVAEIIKTDKTEKIPRLKKASTDFDKLGKLLQEFIDQKEQLQIEKERAEESDRLKSAFLANMSHEIRTPLNGILGFLELLDKPDLTAEQRKRYIKIVNKSGQRLLDTINDILEISMIEAGQSVVQKVEVNTEEIMHYFHLFFVQQAQDKGLTVELDHYVTESDAIIQTDKNKLESILTNLIKNAIKFTNEGGVVFGNYLDDKFLVFYVKDTGIGIPEERMEAVFDRFVQADNSLTRQHEGSGLGLSIVKSYVEMLGGRIWVQSEPNNGSTFYFSIARNS